MCVSTASCCVRSSGRFDASGSFVAPWHVSAEEAFRCVTHGCEFYETPIGVGRKALHPQVQQLRQRRPRVLRRKRDCTPPSSSHSRDGLLARLWGLRRRKDWHLSLPPHTAGWYFGGGGTGPLPHNVRDYLGGGRTGLPPRTVGVYFMRLVKGNNELNILYSQTYRAVTVEGDQQIVTSAVRQSEIKGWTFGKPSEVMQSSVIHTVFLSGDLDELCSGSWTILPRREYLSSRRMIKETSVPD